MGTERRPRALRLPALLLLLLLSLSVACTQVNPATGKEELVIISAEAEMRIGLSVDRQIRTEFKVRDDGPAAARVKSVGARIAAVSDRQDVEYRFALVAANDMNAFAAPGGFVYATSGLVAKADDDELACVIGHECGHIAARHGVKTLQAGMAASLFTALLDKNTKKKEYKAAAQAAVTLLLLGYSRRHEYEADLLGVRYAWRAGYDPHGMVSFFRKLKKVEQKRGSFPEFLSTHPDLDKRIRAVEKVIRTELSNPDGTLKKPPAPPEDGGTRVSEPS